MIYRIGLFSFGILFGWVGFLTLSSVLFWRALKRLETLGDKLLEENQWGPK